MADCDRMNLCCLTESLQGKNVALQSLQIWRENAIGSLTAISRLGTVRRLVQSALQIPAVQYSGWIWKSQLPGSVCQSNI